MKKHLLLISVALSCLLMPPTTSAETLECQGTIRDKVRLVKEVKIVVEKDNTHLISLVPLKSNEEGEFYSDVPVGIGTIEIAERLDKTRLVIAQGKLLVTDTRENLIIGVLIDKGRQYSVRLDRADGKWGFLLHDSNHRESVSGFCK